MFMSRKYLITKLLIHCALLLLAGNSAWAQYVSPPGRTIEPPSLRNGENMDRTALIRRGREQNFAPQERYRIASRLLKMAQSSPNAIDSLEFRQAVSQAPLQARVSVYLKLAKQAGQAEASSRRRFRGMLRENGAPVRPSLIPVVQTEPTTDQTGTPPAQPAAPRMIAGKAVQYSKQIITVSQENLELFRKVLGQNVVWFAVAPSPGHLHTLIADQGRKNGIHHNTYGDNLDDVTMPRSQYAFPVVLTDGEMNRLVRLMNAGGKYGRSQVHGFFGKNRQTNEPMVINTACTNWVTSSTIGELPRWAQQLEKKIGSLIENGTLTVPQVVRAKGLHAALAKVKTEKSRHAIRDAVLATPGLSRLQKARVKAMVKEFDTVLGQWKKRPSDLVLRDSLAKILKLGRSEDPAKWTYDLMMSKRVPVIALLTPQGDAKPSLKTMEFDMEIMGDVNEDGIVEPNDSNVTRYNLGVVPEERRPGFDVTETLRLLTEAAQAQGMIPTPAQNPAAPATN